jgi:site-specific recombinase XerD
MATRPPQAGPSEYTVVEAAGGGGPAHLLVDPDGAPVEPVAQYLRELLASDCSPATLKSYVFALLGWYRFLGRAHVHWERAERQHVRDYVLYLRSANNLYRTRHPSSPPAGSVNARTGKPSLSEGYQPSTINHRLTVIRSFYAFHLRADRGPLTNPVPVETRTGGRRHAHHQPGHPWDASGRSPYRQRQPSRVPRGISDELWAELFQTLTHHRDRAIVCLLISAGARAQEVLGMTGSDVDWGRQCVRLITKGTRNAEWVAASPEFFQWLARYLTERGPVATGEPLWISVRAPRRPLNYQALRAILMRVNQRLGANLVLHDFRHACALRLASDPRLAITDVQSHLRHQHLSSTETYLRARPEEVIRRVQVHGHVTGTEATPASPPRWAYEPRDLDVLLGGPKTPA